MDLSINNNVISTDSSEDYNSVDLDDVPVVSSIDSLDKKQRELERAKTSIGFADHYKINYLISASTGNLVVYARRSSSSIANMKYWMYVYDIETGEQIEKESRERHDYIQKVLNTHL